MERGDKEATRLVLCEGSHDVAFFEHLLSINNVRDYRIASPVNPGGLTGYRRFLRALATGTEYSKVRRILIVADNDSNACQQFSRVRKEIEKSGHPFGVPARPRRLKKSQNGLPAVAILMLPRTDVEGCLETFLLPSLDAYTDAVQPRLRPAVDSYCHNVRIAMWDVSKRSKAILRITITSLNKKNPDLSLASIWNKEKTAKFIKLTGGEFNKLAAFLRRF